MILAATLLILGSGCAHRTLTNYGFTSDGHAIPLNMIEIPVGMTPEQMDKATDQQLIAMGNWFLMRKAEGYELSTDELAVYQMLLNAMKKQSLRYGSTLERLLSGDWVQKKGNQRNDWGTTQTPSQSSGGYYPDYTPEEIAEIQKFAFFSDITQRWHEKSDKLLLKPLWPSDIKDFIEDGGTGTLISGWRDAVRDATNKWLDEH